MEREAQIVGIVAVLPRPVILGREVWELEEEFGVKRDIAEFRLQLLQRHGI